jgi:uncharacterized surface anchored protein
MIRKVSNKRGVARILLIGFVGVTAGAQSGRSWMNGIVFDESDTNGIAGATVELIGDQESARLRSVRLTTQTDSDGKYSFKNVPYGDYTFRVTAPGFTSYQIKLYIASDALTELHVKLRKQK